LSNGFFSDLSEKIRACPFSKATGPGLVHEKCFLGALYTTGCFVFGRGIVHDMCK